MSSTFKILIQNETDEAMTDGRVYNILAEQPSIWGGGATHTHPVTWHLTRPVPSGSQAVFEFTNDMFAFVGRSDVASGGGLSTGATVTLENSLPVKTGTIFNNGDVVLVDEECGLVKLDSPGSGSNKGTIRIYTDASIPHPNPFVIGLARQHVSVVDEGPAPVAAVKLVPGNEYRLTPSLRVWVLSGTRDVWEVQEEPAFGARGAVRVEFRGAFKTAIVIEHRNGDFSVEYR